MPYLDEMETLAQIAVGIAGFAGIIAALRPRQTLNRDSADYARLRELLLTSLGVVFFAFLPPLLDGVLGDSKWAWQGPQCAFAIYHVALMALFFNVPGTSTLTRFEWAIMPAAIGVLVIQFATAFGYFSRYLPEAYYLTLLWFLLVAATDFVVLLLKQEES